MTQEIKLLGGEEVNLILERIAAQVRETHRSISDLAVVGIKRGGDILASRLAKMLGARDIGAIDITLYRDDLQNIPVGKMPEVNSSDVPFEIESRDVLLVDDVLYTGRTVRAAIDELFDYGRPARVQLAVLVDRGGRELPIAADYVGHVHSVTPPNSLLVRLGEQYESDAVFLVIP